MDLFDLTDEPGFSGDELRAIHLLSLATLFINANRPIRTPDIVKEFYAGRSPEAAEKAFQRDRHSLALSGVYVEQVRDASGDVGWQLADRSLALSEELSSADASMLAIICRQCASDPSFPYTDELQMALAKIDRSFDGMIPLPTVETLQPSPQLRELRWAWEHRVCVQASYTDAQGKESSRKLAPYSFFSLGENLYVVGDSVNEAGVPEGRTRTFRTDRFDSVERLEDMPFEIPADFYVDDYRLLPFQIGEPVYEARFFVPQDIYLLHRNAFLAKGSWEKTEGGYLWDVSVSDQDRAVSWAVAYGLKPQSPDGLCDAWRKSLEEVLAHVC